MVMSHGSYNMKLLLLGGTGYLGKKIIAEGLKRNWSIVSISTKKNKNIIKNKKLKYYFFNLRNSKKIKVLSKYKFDYIINASGYVNHDNFFISGYNLLYDHFILLIKIFSIIDKRNLKKFLQIGSSEEYGNEQLNLIEEMREAPRTPYAFSKVASTHFLQMLYRSDSIPIAVLRPFLIYGPGQKENRIIPYVIKNCIKNKKFDISEGSQVRDFLYIDDAVSAIFKCIRSNKTSGNVYNLGSGRGIEIKKLVKLIVNKVGKGRPQFGRLKNNRTESKKLIANILNIKKDLNWKPKVKLTDGLDRTIKFYDKG